jgi:hypothetical protein
MTKSKSIKSVEVELEPDAWPRFERFISDIAKSGPKHRVPTKKPDTGRKGQRRSHHK